VSCHDVSAVFVLLGLDGRAVRGRLSPLEVPAVAAPRPKSPDQGRRRDRGGGEDRRDGEGKGRAAAHTSAGGRFVSAPVGVVPGHPPQPATGARAARYGVM